MLDLHAFYTDVQEYVDNVVHILTKGALGQIFSNISQKTARDLQKRPRAVPITICYYALTDHFSNENPGSATISSGIPPSWRHFT